MAELKVYQRREKLSGGNAMEEEEVLKLRLWVPDTPEKPKPGRSQRTYVRRKLKNHLGQNSLFISDSQVELGDSNGVSMFSDDTSFSDENNGFSNQIAALPTKEEVQNCSGSGDPNLGSVGLFDLNKCLLESDDLTDFMGFEDTSKGFLEAKWADEEVEIKRGSFEKMSTCFFPGVQSHVDEERLQKPIEDMLVPSLELQLGAAIPDSMSQCKPDDQQFQESFKQENVIYHTENRDQKSNAGSALPSTKSLSQKKNNLKRKQDGTDLSKRPQKRPKKKVHRPKVVGFGKSRTLEPKTPKKATPKRASSKSKAPKPTTGTPASSKKNMLVKKSLSNPKLSASIEVTEDKVDPSVSDTAALTIDLKNQSKDENAIVLATPPPKLISGRRKPMNSSLDSEDNYYILPIDTEAEKSVGNCINYTDFQYNAFQADQKILLENQCLSYIRETGPKLPKIRGKRSMSKRRWGGDRWSKIPWELHKNASKKPATKISLEKLDNFANKKKVGIHCPQKETTDLTKSLSLIMTKKVRSKGYTRRRNLDGITKTSFCNLSPRALLRETVGERQEIENFQSPDANKDALLANANGGMMAEKWTNMGNSLVHSELQNGEREGYPLEQEVPCSTKSRECECKEGMVEANLTEMVPSLLNLEFVNNKSDRSLQQNEILQLTDKSIVSQQDNISLLIPKCSSISHRYKYLEKAQDVQIPSNDYGILVPYQGQKDLDTHAPQGGHGILATYKGKYNKRLEKLSPTERVLALSWKEEIQGKANETQVKEGDEEWWKNEREVFRGRINLLISRMHLIQGDRRFSPWKGSVVDSVVGVFLTQNVSDHLSSSAFMSLAARFPCQTTFNKTYSEDIDMVGSQESIGSCIVSIEPVSDEELLTCKATTLMEDENRNTSPDIPNDSLCNSYKPPEVPEINFNEKEGHLGIFKDSVVLYNPRVQQRIPTKFGSDASVGMFSMPSESSSPTNNAMAAQNFESHIYSVTMPLDKPEKTFDSLIQNPKICVQPLNNDNNFNQRKKEEKKMNLEENLSDMKFGETKTATRKRKNEKAMVKAKTDWDFCRKIYSSRGERHTNYMDSVDWEAVRHAEVKEIAEAIQVRGQQNIIAGRVKKFLNQVHEDHKQIDLEWLRNAPPELVTKYLREIEGIGLKSVECVRLLALQHVAFPVDVNVGRIAIRLGWVPLQPLPESLQIHLLQEMPVLDSIQKYLWPRLQTLDPLTLYELHYQMITFGKIYCTKRDPNCNSCPMRGECRHYSSAFASARLSLPGPEKKPRPTKKAGSTALPVVAFEALKSASLSLANPESKYQTKSCEPIIEEPASPQPESPELADIEDLFLDDPNYIPVLRMRDEKISTTLEPFTGVFQENDTSMELLFSEAAYNIPARKWKDVERLRTKHQVYVVPDYHPLLAALEIREPDDPCPYLLAIWPSDESTTQPQKRCNSQESMELCNGEKTCFSDNNLPKQAPDSIHGTILIPCRTATRGRFPLNGTYFQNNEIFADYESSIHPINVPRSWIWRLDRRIAYFGTSTSAIVKALPEEVKQECFWRGFLCVRAFDRKTRRPHQLSERFHISTGMAAGKKNRKEDE